MQLGIARMTCKEVQVKLARVAKMQVAPVATAHCRRCLAPVTNDNGFYECGACKDADLVADTVIEHAAQALAVCS